MTNAICARALTKYYGKIRGIVGLNLEVMEGDFYGFIGPNGAGKSTAIRTLLGLIRPDSGRAEIFGMDIAANREQILAQTGYLPSETAFYFGRKVQDILQLSANLRRRDCRRTAKELCERLRLDPGRKIEELSYGNRKKAGIVCALQHNPRLYNLDKPTGGLDPLAQREFFSILKERNRQGATIFLSSHVLSEIERHCSQAAILREGTVIASGTVAELSRTSARRVTLAGNFTGDNNIGCFQDFIRDYQQEEGRISFLYSGDINRLLQVLTCFSLRDLTISEPNLEEIFLHYYANAHSMEGEVQNDSDLS